MSRFAQNTKFLWQFFCSPFKTGAIVPSSRHLAEMMISDINIFKLNTIVEVGAGTGVFTKKIIDQTKPNAKILVFELNPAMAKMLQENLLEIEVIADSAANIKQHLKTRNIVSIDCAICGLPWANFSNKLQDEILQSMFDSLSVGGYFTTFAYIHASKFPTALNFKKKLQKMFRSVEASPIVWKNIPPAFVWRCQK